MIPQYIYDLLLENDYVVVPGLGGFVCQNQSAIIDRQRAEIMPPSRTIAFNRMLQQNDGLLVQYIVMKNQLTHKYAEETVREFVAKCNEQLHQMGSVQFPRIGRLYIDELKNIQFSPAYEPFPLDDSFGLGSISVIPIRRYESVESEEDVLVATDNIVELKPQRRWPYWVAATFAGLFILGSTWLNLGQPSINNMMTAGVFSGKMITTSNQQNQIEFDNQGIQADYLSSHQLQKPAQLEDLAIQSENLQNENISLANANVFSVVVGAFKKATTAEKFKTTLESKGYQVEIIAPSGNNKLIKVVIHYVADNEDIALADIRNSVDKNAWLFN
ncbi:MAG: hypothetical protein M9888_09040 [Chitinophagales bacterium]|nr:hypothetical protein [Chitinophagales bacterium]